MVSKMTQLMMVIVIVSFLGFITENIWTAFRFGTMDNRGMIMPGLLGYGIAMLLVYFILGTPDAPMFFGISVRIENRILKRIYYVAMAAIFVSVGEILLGNLVEKMCHIEWWNYESLPMHIGKYTSVLTSLGFGLLISVFMDQLFPVLLGMTGYIKRKSTIQMMYFCLIGYVVDFFHEAKYMIRKKEINKRWTIDLHEKCLITNKQVHSFRLKV